MKKDYEKYMLYVVLLVVLVGLVYSFSGFFKTDKEDNKVSFNNVGFKTISSGSTDSGDVSIDLTPQGFNKGKLDVKIDANTHSVDLSQFDLKKIISLEYDGKIVNPTEAPSLSGHHASGNLIFDIGKEISGFVIRIKEIPKIEERVFEWE